MAQVYQITAFYRFFPIQSEDLGRVQADLHTLGETLNLCGLVLVASEGINGTVAGSEEAIDQLKQYILSLTDNVIFKDSTTEEKPFKRWHVKIREEIVALGNTNIYPTDDHHHVTPEEWNKLCAEEDVVIVDARNDYETAIGMFEGAIDPKLKMFSEFPTFVEKCDIPKDKKILMYCTGGIRCEKALLEMEQKGYKQVYQLKGGILQYLKDCPNQNFKGECFVFDHRTAVDQQLEPSKRYSLCPHTGDPADLPITCSRCGQKAVIAAHCDDIQKQSCSKDCAFKQRETAERVLAK